MNKFTAPDTLNTENLERVEFVYEEGHDNSNQYKWDKGSKTLSKCTDKEYQCPGLRQFPAYKKSFVEFKVDKLNPEGTHFFGITT